MWTRDTIPSHPGPGRHRIRRTHDHGPVSQLGPEEHCCGHKPKCLGRHEGLRRPGTEVLLHSPSLSCHGKGGSRPLRGAQKELRQAGRRILLAGRQLVRLPGRRLSRRPWTRAPRNSDGRRNGRAGSHPPAVNGAKRTGHRRGCPRKRRHRRGCGRSIRAARLQRDRHDLSLCRGARDRAEEQLCQNGGRGASDTAGSGSP